MTAPRLEKLSVKNLRSIGPQQIVLDLPKNGPLVLLGENNAGKSNITRALDMIFGERWPGTFQPDDHDFFGRSSDGIEINIGANVSGLWCDRCSAQVDYISWNYYSARDSGGPCEFLRNGCVHTFMSNAVREQLFCMLVGADRRLTYQLSYASKYTFLSKLMHRFHEKLIADEARVGQLRTIFDDLLSQFNQVAEFQNFRKLLGDTAESFGQNLAYRLDIDFSAYDPSNFYRSLRVHPKLAGDVRSFDELGTGQEQILALAFSYAYARAFGKESGLILVIDEPESHLHPLAQQWLSTRLNALATEGLQVIVATHSPHFVDLSLPENLVVVSKPDDVMGTKVVQVSRNTLAQQLVDLGADENRTMPDTVGAFYKANATNEIVSGLFSRLCVLVEGPTESLSFPELLRLVDFDTLKNGVALVSVGGLGNLARWLRLLKILGIPVYVLFDSDSNKTGKDAVELLAKREDLMSALGRTALEANIAYAAPLTVNFDHAVLDANFEDAMRKACGSRWDELIAESRDEVGDSKPLQARCAAKQLAVHDLAQDFATALQRFADTLTSLLLGGHAETEPTEGNSHLPPF